MQQIQRLAVELRDKKNKLALIRKKQSTVTSLKAHEDKISHIIKVGTLVEELIAEKKMRMPEIAARVGLTRTGLRVLRWRYKYVLSRAGRADPNGSVDQLVLPNRFKYIFEYDNISHIPQLLAKTDAELCKYRWIGSNALRTLDVELARHGLKRRP